jgi:hypothetical protein
MSDPSRFGGAIGAAALTITGDWLATPAGVETTGLIGGAIGVAIAGIVWARKHRALCPALPC